MEAERDPDRSRRTFRALALAAGLWFLGSGIWGLVTETPADRATSGCEAAASQRLTEPGASATHTVAREEQAGWVVAGEVRRSVDNVVTVTHRWECATDGDGRNPAVTAWIES